MKSKILLRYLDNKDKITLLNEVLDLADFETEIETVRKSLGKDREELKIAIKPNASMFVRRDDDGVTTDPLLVLALVEYLHELGYKNILVVESSNAYELTYTERNPVTVMTAMGLNGGVHSFVSAGENATAHVADSNGSLLPYQLVDLGAHTTTVNASAMPHGTLKLATEWLTADFRISFAKFKTHVYGGYTLLIKNTYGCLPEGNKMWHYHRATGCAKPTVEQLKICPVHFGIIDGIIAADGWLGVKWDRAIPRLPGFILAGRNIGETERIACRIMGVNVDQSQMTEAALDFLSEPVELDGEIRPLKKWWNVPGFIVSGFPITEKYYRYYTFQQTVTDGLGTFPFRRRPLGIILTYLLIAPALIYAFHRRHWIIRKFRDLKLRLAIKPGTKAPSRVRSHLDRLDIPELEVLLECLASGSAEPPRIYGHKIKANGKLYQLPGSTFSRLVRIPEIIEKLKTAAEKTNCAREIEARLEVLTGGN
ncbi:MAG: DUF362 domain-containing protein [bacterium]|nr:DUF362 domain-containing protein [bacterium]